MSDLLPCPFCGDGYPELRKDDGKFCVICSALDCYCAMGEGFDRDAMPDHSFYDAETATAAWNRRPAITRDDIEEPRP